MKHRAGTKEQLKPEESLRKNEELYKDLYRVVRLMCDNVSDLLWAKDMEKKFIFVNKAICEKLLNAKDANEPIGKTDMFFAERERKANPDDPEWHTFGEICADSDSVVMKSRKAERFDEFGNVKGEYLNLDVYKAPIWDEHGEMIGTVGCGREVTRERKIEEELRKSEKRYRAIVEDQTELICRFLPDGTITFVNETYCSYFGKKKEDLIGHSFMPLIPDEDRSMVRQRINSLCSETPVITYEHQVILPGGKIRWMCWKDHAIFDDKNKIIEYQSVGRDITERKEMEETLKYAKIGLEQQVRERTAELSLKNEQRMREIEELRRTEERLHKTLASLRVAHEELKLAQLQVVQAAKMESVGILAAGVAHEVKNPLATIQMGVEYLSNRFSSLDKSSKMVLQNMEDAVYRADSIVRDLLEFSYINEVDFEESQLNDIILQSISLVKHELEKKNIKLEENLSRDLSALSFSTDRICQVFVNIFLNAIHASPDGGILKVRTYEKKITTKGHFKISENVVVAEVEDMGEGIPEEDIMRIFDPFFTTKPMGKGTGLGLAVSKKIMESHGGKIEIMNRKEGGVKTTVMFKT